MNGMAWLLLCFVESGCLDNVSEGDMLGGCLPLSYSGAWGAPAEVVA